MIRAKILLLCGLTLGLLAFLGWVATTAQAGRLAPSPLQAQTEPSPRYGHTMVTISDTVYLFGGEGVTTSTVGYLPLAPSIGLNDVVILNDLWAYDSGSSEWQKEGNTEKVTITSLG